MLYLDFNYELLPNKCTHFPIRGEIQNLKIFKQQFLPDVSIFILKYYFIPILEKRTTVYIISTPWKCNFAKKHVVLKKLQVAELFNVF